MVYKATDPSGHVIAVKAFTEPVNKAKAEMEFAVGYGLHHPNLGRCLDYRVSHVHGHCQPSYLLILEYIGGGELYDMVKHRPFSEGVCRFLFSQIL